MTTEEETRENEEKEKEEGEKEDEEKDTYDVSHAKLVDLVSWLTNKIDKNIEEIQAEIVSHKETTDARFVVVAEEAEKRVQDLENKIDERRKANAELIEKIRRLQSKQNDLAAKYNILDGDVDRFKEQTAVEREEVIHKIEGLAVDIAKSVDKQNKLMEHYDARLVELTEKLDTRVTESKENHETSTTSILDKVEVNRVADLDRNNVVVDRLDELEKRILECEEATSTLKNGIASNKKMAEKQEEDFKEQLRSADRKSGEVCVLMEQFKDRLDSMQQSTTNEMDNLDERIKSMEAQSAAHKEQQIEIAKSVTEVESSVTKVHSEITFEIEETRNRLSIQQSLNTNLADVVDNNKEQHETFKTQQFAVIEEIRTCIENMQTNFDSLDARVKEKGGAEATMQKEKMERLDTLYAGQEEVEKEMRTLEESVRCVDDALSKTSQEAMAAIIQTTDTQGKLSGNLTEKWGALDVQVRTMKTDFKNRLETMINELENNMKTETVEVTEQVEEIRKMLDVQRVKFEKEINVLNETLVQTVDGMRNDVDTKYIDITDNIEKLGTNDVAAALDNLKTFHSRIKGLEVRVEDMENLIDEHPREWTNNLLFHGIEIDENETFLSLAAHISRIIRRNLGVRREMMVTGIRRLTPSRSDIEGWPPLVVTLQHPQDREEILSRTQLLKGTNIMITEDMPRCLREEWGELYRFLAKVKTKYPSSVCILKEDRLYVDNKIFVWDKDRQKIVEQPRLILSNSGAVADSTGTRKGRE